MTWPVFANQPNAGNNAVQAGAMIIRGRAQDHSELFELTIEPFVSGGFRLTEQCIAANLGFLPPHPAKMQNDTSPRRRAARASYWPNDQKGVYLLSSHAGKDDGAALSSGLRNRSRFRMIAGGPVVKRIVRFLVPVILILLSPEIPAQAPTPDHPARYHLIQVVDATFLDKVNEAAHQGYRLIAMTAATGSLVAIMERIEQPAPFNYLAVPLRGAKKFETAGKTKTEIAEQLNAAAEKGYRLHMTLGNLAVMESTTDPGHHYQYALTSPSGFGYFKKDEISGLIAAGYHWAASTDAMFLIFERAVPSDHPPHDGPEPQPRAHYSHFTFPENNFVRSDLPEKQLHKLASEGARVVDFFGSPAQMILAMEEAVSPSSPYEYIVLKPKIQSQFALHAKMSKVEAADLTRAGQQGFRLLPISAPAPPFVMEKVPGTTKHYEYQFITAPRLSDLAEQLNDPSTNRFDVAKLATTDEGFLVVLEKRDAE